MSPISLRTRELARTKRGGVQVVSQPRQPTQLAAPPILESAVSRTAEAERVADYYQQRGLSGPALQQETGIVLGGFAKLESAAYGFRHGLRFFSLMMLGIGLTVAWLLWRAARILQAPPGAGYS
jgi:hypothetical protein